MVDVFARRRSTPGRERSVRLRTAGIVVGICLPILLFGSAMVVLFENQQRDFVTQGMQRDAGTVAQGVLARLVLNRTMLEDAALSQIDEIDRDRATRILDNRDFLQLASRLLRARPRIQGLRWMRPGLPPLDLGRRGIALPPVSADLMVQPWPTPQSILSELVSLPGEPPLVAVRANLGAGQGDGNLIAFIDTSSIVEVLTRYEFPGGWPILVVDEMLTPFASDGDAKEMATVRAALADPMIGAELRAGKSHIPGAGDSSGDLTLVAAPVPRTRWMLVMGAPADLIAVPGRHIQWAIAAALLLSGLLTLGMAGLALRGYRLRMEAHERDAIRAVEQRSLAIIESTNDAIIEADRNLRITFLNGAARAMIDQPGDLIGRDAGDLFPALAPGSDLRLRCHRVLTTGQPDELEMLRLATPRWVHVRLFPNPDGRIVAYVRDITDRKLSEQTVAGHRSLLERLIETLPDPIFAKDLEGRYLLANSALASTMGCDRRELIGRSDLEMAPAEQLGMIQEVDRMVLAEGRLMTIERTVDNGQGRLRHLLISVAPLKDAQGQVAGLVGTSRDMTELRQVEEHLRHSQRLEAVGRLTGGIAHDFNNLLLVIVTNLDLMLSLTEEEDLRQLAEEALAAADRGSLLTKRLLVFARRSALNPRAVDLNALVAGMLSVLRRTLSTAIDLRFEPGEGLWPAMADPGQVEDALLNLVINARDAMPNGGRILIRTGNEGLSRETAKQAGDMVPGDYAWLSVIDSGTGMTAEVLNRAIEPFFTTKDVGKGTGLGLSQIYGFAKQSGGHFRLESEVGIGTAARIYLPRAGLLGSGAHDDRIGDDLRGDERILVCEESFEARRETAASLRALGYRIVEAADEATALERLGLGQERVDLILADLVMSGGNRGVDLARRACQLVPGIRVLLMSGYDGTVGRGAEEFALIAKPFGLQALARRLREVLDRPAPARVPEALLGAAQDGERGA
ncbi:PAS domain-containing protein [Zavarzinia sp. CC-PAN008]|uniref:hybrid sensor histidine kinase/response regulator n=1 Tax=Zavarzinia sp. CC-PAN008 TaxID=3243332 RepID=UPI003F747319